MYITVEEKKYYGTIDKENNTFTMNNDLLVDVIEEEEYKFFSNWIKKKDYSEIKNYKKFNILYKHNDENFIIMGLYPIKVSEDLIVLKYDQFIK